MTRAPFITPAMSIVLDAVRFLAALAVLLGHMQWFGLYTGPWPFDERFHHFAVVVFFVLSGLVIAHSVDARNQDFRAYTLARVARIVPVAWLAIAFGTTVYLLADGAGIAQAAPEGRGGLSPEVIWVPALFLNESLGGLRPIWNNAYWSLAYEVWFYALFAAWSFARGRQRILWVTLVALLAGWRIVLLLPVWLMGVALARAAMARMLLSARNSAALAILALGLMALAVAAGHRLIFFSETVMLGFGLNTMASKTVLPDLLFGAGFALLLVALRGPSERFGGAIERLRRPAQWGAGFSFSLYIFHYPVVMLFAALGWGAGSSALGFALQAAAFLAGAALIAEATEKRTPHVKRWLARYWPATPSSPGAVPA